MHIFFSEMIKILKMTRYMKTGQFLGFEVFCVRTKGCSKELVKINVTACLFRIIRF